MEKRIYVGNLAWKIKSDDLKIIFSEFGEVVDARVIKDKFTRKSKGFGFVTFASSDSAEKAVSSMNQKEVEGRPLKVSIAKEIEPRR